MLLPLLLLSRFSRVRLCNATDGSPPGPPIPGTLQARTVEWVAISFSQSLICLTLAWRIPGTGEPGGLPSMVLQSWTRLKRLSSSSGSSNPMNSFSSNLELCLFGRPALCSYVTKQL